MRWLNGKDVQVKHGLQESIDQLSQETQEFRDQIKKFLDGLISHYVFDDGKLVVAHAGLKESMQGRGSAAVREFCLYGETTGETDEFGLPVRHNWAAEYKGRAMVVYGHTPVPQAQWLNNTIDIDTGCVFGGSLTEQFVTAYQQYCWPVNGLDDYKLAPFHILASEGKLWTSEHHEWHMEQIKKVCSADPAILLATPYRVVELDKEASVQEATEWWLTLTGKGGEGMVVKPYSCC